MIRLTATLAILGLIVSVSAEAQTIESDQQPQPAPQPPGNQQTVGTGAATDCARPGDTHRRRAVRRCVAAGRVVAARPQPGDHLGSDRDGKDGTACRPPEPRARQRRAAQRGLGSSGASGDVLRLAERGFGT